MLLIVLKEFKKSVPKKMIKHLKKILPVKGVEQDVESHDEDTKEVLKYCIKQSEHTEINPMTNFKKSNHKGSRRI